MESKNKRAILKDEYPLNLIRALTDEKIEDYGIQTEKITDDVMDGLTHALSTLTEREQRILQLRYQERKTLREIGEAFGVTTEAIRSQEHKALRKLRNPPRLGYIKYGKKGFEKRIAERRAEHERAFKERGFKIPIDELDLSVRAFNSLVRKNCATVEDMISLTTEDIESINNLGPKTKEEIALKLESLGAFHTAWSNYLPKEKV